MRVFVTGTTGFVGSAVVQELLSHGHQVLGLARSAQAAEQLGKVGVEALRGDLADHQSLKAGAERCDATIHTGFNHDFSRFAENCELDRKAILAMGEAMAGSHKPFIVTSGTGVLGGLARTVVETDRVLGSNVPRRSEQAAAEVAKLGVKTMVVRLAPSTHGEGDHGFVPLLIHFARQHGAAACVGEGANRWNAVHRLDAATLYRLALEKGEAGAHYHAVAEEAVPFVEIAKVIARRLELGVKHLTGEEAAAYFGWFSHFAGLDIAAASALTRQQLGWQPTRPGLLTDLDNPYYFAH